MKRSLPLFFLVFAAVLFGFSLFELFKLRYEVGDVYPEYSSLRSDPLGTMVLFESLEQLPQHSVQRDFSPANKLPETPNSTYLHLAASRWDWMSLPEELFQEAEVFMLRGGRLVVTFFPETSSLSPPVTGPGKPSRTPKKNQKTKKVEGQLVRRTSVKERWGIETGYIPLKHNASWAYEPATVFNQSALPLPSSLDWHSSMIFTNVSLPWRTIYARGNVPVVIERKFGAGSIVLATDSYFLSNEAMAKDRHADLLAWVLGTSHNIMFDEAHLGIVEAPGLTTLMRKYRLESLAVSLLLLAGLFVWKNATPFLAPFTDELARGEIIGKETSAGLVNLLRRNIPPSDVLRVCFEEWTKSLLAGSSHSISRVDQAQAVLEREAARAKIDRDPVRAYRQICAILKGRRADTKELLPSTSSSTSAEPLVNEHR
jgi:hypothetical protein